MNYISSDILKKVYKPRPENSQKYDFGYVLAVGGSQLYSGSPALCAMAAMRAGADLNLVVAPERAANIIASFSPNLISYSLKGHDLGLKHLPTLFSLTEGAKKVSRGKAAVVIGGGLGRDEETQKTIRKYLPKISIPAVIDADAIWAVSKEKEILKNGNFVLTPHNYEFFVLSGTDVSKFNLQKKIEAVKNFAGEFKTTVLLKGNPDIISDGGEVFLNKTGCAEMAVGGTGDALAGICGCFLSQETDLVSAVCAAAYISGKAGELAKEKFGAGLLATDVIENIPKAANSGLSLLSD